MNLSYDYDDLLQEVKSDYAEGLLKETIFIVRGQPLADGYKPIIDYYYSMDELDEKVEVAKTQKIIEEMERKNDIFGGI